ncbi:MAG: hypothetical protein AB1428_08400 [Bacteroidota bacterium]
MTVREILREIRAIRLRQGATIAEQTVAEELLRTCCPRARVSTAGEAPVLTLRLEGEEAPWYSFTVSHNGGIAIGASQGALLYAAMRLATEEWGERSAEEFGEEKRRPASFRWLRNLSDFLVGSLRHARHFDRQGYCRQLAAQGFTHMTVNGLGVARPFESSPPGDVYHWFYDYSPDLDQFVDSTLLRGYYPSGYLAANLKFLKETAQSALRYGLVPGLHINSPRSMPEEFWEEYGYLRGARVDHPRETLRPRYTLAMAHPAVQEHYRELVRAIMAEIPEIGFIYLWTNDSGSGFEFVSALYAGRNGGPYLIREWKSHAEIARAAAGNVLKYFRLLRDEGRRANPAFRLVCDLGSFRDERPEIIRGMGDGIDAGDFGYFEGGGLDQENDMLRRAGAETHAKTEVGDNNVLGVPYPRLVHERLGALRARGGDFVLTGGTPASLAPFDINREVVRAFQLTPERSIDDVLRIWSERWGGVSGAAELLDLWNRSDSAVRGFPSGVPMSTFGFPWFRLWVRPFVPDIDAIPEQDRRYYEEYLLATFNNPARVDLNNDMMWNFLTVEEAGEKRRTIDRKVLAPLTSAIEQCVDTLSSKNSTPPVFADLHDRLRAARAFYRTLRNMVAWIESVHGYCGATDPKDRTHFRSLCDAMVEDELANARDLLDLWRSSRTDFMPVSTIGETLHCYGENFGDLLSRKIALMEKHGKDEPHIDPQYMWRMHERVPDQ